MLEQGKIEAIHCVLIPIDEDMADLTAMDVTLKEIARRDYCKVPDEQRSLLQVYDS